jgi:hypothetical protein
VDGTGLDASERFFVNSVEPLVSATRVLVGLHYKMRVNEKALAV